MSMAARSAENQLEPVARALRDTPQPVMDLVQLHLYQRLGTLFERQRALSRSASSGTNRQELLSHLSALVEESFPGARCCIICPGDGCSSQAPAARSQSNEAQQPFDILSGPVATALANRGRIVASDLSREHRWPNCTERALSQGVMAIWVELLIDSREEICAIFVITHDAPRVLTPADECVLNSLMAFCDSVLI